MSGIFLLDKPAGLTSSAALARVRGIYRAKKGGHTGSLDPLASGLLPVCLGECAKFASFFLEGRKKYLASGRLGEITPSADTESEVTERREVGDAPQRLEEVCKTFLGKIEQIPPLYSAVKVGGRPLYRYARRGQQVDIPVREVEIFSLKLTAQEGANFTVEVCCSKGTYIRTLIADIGEALGCGAHVTALRRLAVEGLPENAMTGFEELQSLADGRNDPNDFTELDKKLLSLEQVMGRLPAVELPEDRAVELMHGQWQGPDFSDCTFRVATLDNHGTDSTEKLGIWCRGRFLGVGHLNDENFLIPDRLLSDPLGINVHGRRKERTNPQV